MQFNSYLFLFLFLPVTLAGYFGLHRSKKERAAKVFLAAASLLFYGWGNSWYLILILGSAAFNWAVSRMFYLGREKPGGRADISCLPKRKWLLALGITLNIALLFYYKYYNFFLENLNLLLKEDLILTTILLPVGISFFTFQQIAWLVDSCRGETEGYGWLDYVIFTVYFPKIAMGPILLHGEFIPQLGDPSRQKARAKNISRGLMALSVGLFKKVILAEFFASPVTWGFSQVEALSAADAFMVMLAYTFQLYFDFSGYCDMAMGVSEMFNIVLPQNFDSPYKALSPVDFWKRWHMTLTRFLRRYVYFPLGGSRKGRVRTYINIMAIFLVSGLWHGANWTYILWGLLHGLAQSLNRAFDRQWQRLHTAFQWMATFLFVNVAWVLFRAESISQAKTFIKKLAWLGNMQLSPGFIESFQMVELPQLFQNHRIMTVMLIYGLALHLVMNTGNMSEAKLKPTLLRGVGTAVLMVWSVISLAGISTFIYFQF